MVEAKAFLKKALQIDKDCAGDPSRRRHAMELLRQDYYVQYVAESLKKASHWASASDEERLAESERIWRKIGGRFVQRQDGSRRSKDEERLVVSARVAWHKILKSEGIAAARPRSANPSLKALTGSGSKVRRLSSLKSEPERGAVVLTEYVEGHVRHLRDICALAQQINPEFLTRELKLLLTELEAFSSSE